MKVDWSALTDELSMYRRAGLALPLWWRDDDAVADTPALERLAALSGDVGLPVYVAVIPDLIEPTLAPVIASDTNLVPVIHGWRHISHAPDGAKNAEFGYVRQGAEEELALAPHRLRAVFGHALVPLFVPPWNRISPHFMPVLHTAGYWGVSTFGPREAAQDSSGIQHINTHVDPIFWRGDRGLVNPETLIAELVRTLQERRRGEADAQEPLGLLTHHLVHTEDVWEFSGDVLRVLLDGGAAPSDVRAMLQSGR